MDKNKNAYKLKGLPPLYYINLDANSERDEYIKNHLDYWEVEDYTRISGNDGRDKDLSHILTGKHPENMSSSEVGCTTSHLKAIKYWMETSNSPCAIIAEDDLNLSVVSHWNFSWKDFYSLIPYDYDVLQLAIISRKLITKLHKRFIGEFSCAAYMITRHHAEKLLRFHTIGDKYKLDQGVKPRAVSDDLIYNTGNTYSIPLWLYNIELESSIHKKEHIEFFHKYSYTNLFKFWLVNGAKLDIRKMMDYNP